MKDIKFRRRLFILVLTIQIAVSHCTVKRINMENLHADRNENLKLSWFQSITYGSDGLPYFYTRLEGPPSESGTTYVVAVFDDDEKPLKSFQIQISESQEKADASKPLQVIYEWTGKGFLVGCQIAGEVLESGIPRNIESFACVVIIGTASVAACSLGGFIIGVGASTPLAYEELKRIRITGDEVLLSISEYEYDQMGRMVRLTMYHPGPDPIILTETQYFYRGNEESPYKSINRSMPEKKTRIIE